MASQDDSDVFSVRIVSLDYYMSPPIPDLDPCYSSFQGTKVEEVPVIRIFGATPAGQKTCLHVHGALPYFYVPFPDDLLQSPQEGHAFIHTLFSAIEKAFKHKPKSKRQHVHDYTLVRAKNFYGFHPSEEVFVKIILSANWAVDLIADYAFLDDVNWDVICPSQQMFVPSYGRSFIYYPHDIHRAASLLLDGSILGKSLQPFESHIPYLLQFLVDYNLHGMSHLHTSKVRFRSPLIYFPNSAAIRPKNYDMPATPSSYTPKKPKVWVSSTVPSAQLWPDSTASLDSTENKYNHLTRRQSICQLEADASVEDIINEKSKIFTSLSQTSFDVRMVQSLVPIWEEEYERSGIQEAFKQDDPNKPHPDDVLRSFMLGFDYDKTLSEFYQKACNTFPSRIHVIDGDDKIVKYMNSFSGISRKVELAGDQQQDSFCDVQLLGGEDNKSKEILSSQKLLKGDLKCLETEALGLLSWLASSQAEDELDGGDELLQEAILSPLLPGKPYSVALEIAHNDYENASQLECQDILDSVEDLIESERSKEPASSSFQDLFLDSVESILKSEGSKEQALSSSRNLLDDVTSAAVIAQVDGSFDESLETQKGNTYEDNMSYRGENAAAQSNEMNSKVTCNSNENKLWGTLPFSVNKRKREVSESFSLISSPGYEIINDGSHNLPIWIKGADFYDSVKNEIGLKNCSEKRGKTIGLCSARDLMRKKRCLRVKIDEAQVQQNEDMTPGQNEELTPTISKRESIFFPVEEPSIGQSLTHQNVLGNIACSTILSSGFQGTKCIEHQSIVCHSHPVQKSFAFLSPGLQSNPDLQSSAGLQPSTVASENFGVNQGSIINEVKISNGSLNLAAGDLNMQETDSKKLFEVSVVKPVGSTVKPARSVSYNFFSEVCINERPDSSPNIMKCHSINHYDNSVENDALKTHIHKNWTSGYDAKKHACYPDSGIAQELLLPEKHLRRYQQSSCLFDDNCRNFCKENALEGFFEMTFVNKPPSNEHTHDPEVSSTAGQTDGNIDNKQGMENIMPFFPRASQDVNLHNETVILSQGLALGIPTHFQNDGSALYLLTHALSPPPLSTVYDYLSGERQHSVGVFNCENSPPIDADQLLYDSSESNDGKCSSETENFHLNIGYVSSEPRLGSIIAKEKVITDDLHDLSQISGPEKYENSNPTPLSQIGFRDPACVGCGQQLTLISMELLAESRGDLRPDPKFDAINALSLVVQEDASNMYQFYVLIRVVDEKADEKNHNGVFDCKLFLFTEEKLLLEHFVEIVSYLDPDILMGWEIQRSSLGYIVERAFYLGMNILKKISRTPLCEKSDNTKDSGCPDFSDDLLEATTAGNVLDGSVIEDEWGRNHASGFHVGGRIVLNIWRLMRAELKLNMYTAEAVAEEVLRQKIPLFSDWVLNQWYSSGIARARHKCIEYVIARSMLTIQIMSQLDMINRTSELARIFGIDFFSVISRGSQYRVESMLLRLAHTQNYLAISPGHQQVASQPAMECLPLVMEPESGFYVDPVVVLDFQSLYPSMIIAYNLCFCTCLGKAIPSRENVLGVSSYSPDVHILKDLGKKLLLTPNGALYVPAEVRKGVLSRLLEEILSTRIMVKQTMKKLTSSQLVLHRILNARQLALKLIANVTYGYTAAGFSGRMPCAEIADSIVQCGRRTLEAAISFVNQYEKWNAKVIYGDTDSMFVLLKGRTKEDAFIIGNEIAAAITKMNPEPVTLKMEKVYQPCFLLTKKRYVGYSYESPRQEKPSFDAKGIETVRRDTCSAVSKTLERSIRLFFESRDLSEVKSYLKRQWIRLLAGKISLKDFVFAKEVRLGSYRASSLPPAAIVARKAMEVDPRAEPHYGERVPYVVVHGEPGSRLMDMVVNPFELLDLNSPYRPNNLYYINKQMIPALQRVFGLLGVNIYQWFSAIPHPTRPLFTKRYTDISHSRSVHEDCNNNNPTVSKNAQAKRSRIDRYYSSMHCPLCGGLIQSSDYFCIKCSKKEPLLAAAVVGTTSVKEREIQHLAEICRHCGGGDWTLASGVKCISLSCPVFYERRKVQKELEGLSSFATAAGFYPPCNAELF